ncbi:MAG: preprotein translocase subunit YajC [Saprospiraceae bacterium]
MIFTNLFILQGEGGAGMINLIFMAVLFSLFYFFFIRPQAKKQKEQIAFMNAIQKGDEVVTSSGIIGSVNKLEDSVITLQVDPKTFLRVLNSSISKEMTDAYKKLAKSEA